MTAKRTPWDRQRALVLLALATGHSRAAASAKAGIADRTLRRWVADDEAFGEAVEVAMGEGRAVYEQLLREAGQKDWRAALAAYEVIYLGGTRGGARAEASATLLVASAPPVPKQLTDEDRADSIAHAQNVVRILVGVLGPERASDAIAARELERRRLG